MLTVNATQYQRLANDQVNRFIIRQMELLRTKHPELIESINTQTVYIAIHDVIQWAAMRQINAGDEIEYLLNLFFKFSMTLDALSLNVAIANIFRDKTRQNMEKLHQLHHYLEFTKI